MNNLKECFGKIEYDFKREDLSPEFQRKYDELYKMAIKSVKEEYEEEQDIFNEEYEEEKSNGDVDNIEEFMENNDYSINYSLSFEESLNKGDKGSEMLEQEIKDMANRYAVRVFDLPKSAIVENMHKDVFDDNIMRNEAMKSAVSKQTGLPESCFKIIGERTPTNNDKIRVKAYNSINKMMNSKDYNTYLKIFVPVEKKYSFNNTLSIYANKPSATIVKGYKSWESLGRKPFANSGIPILQPVKTELKNEKQVDKYIEKQVKSGAYPSVDCKEAIKEKEALMKTIETFGKAEIAFSYKPTYVFDISDTYSLNPEKDNLQDILNLNKPLLEKVNDFDKVADAIDKVAQNLIPNFHIDRNTSQQEVIFDAIEKYADEILTNCPEKVDGITSYDVYKGDIHKIETTMTAYMICENIGIECSEKAGLKLANIFDKNELSKEQCELGNRGMFEKAFERAFALKSMFNKELNQELGIDLEKEIVILENSFQSAKEESIKHKEENKDNYEAFGKRQLLICDKWQKDNSTYTVGYDDVQKNYCVKCETPTSKGTLSTDYACKFSEYTKKTGETATKKTLTSFEKEPTRDSVEYIIDMGRKKENFDADKIVYVGENAKANTEQVIDNPNNDVQKDTEQVADTPNNDVQKIDLTNRDVILEINSIASDYYCYFYEDRSRENDDYHFAIEIGDNFISQNPDFCKAHFQTVGDIYSSDREIASLAFALAEKGIIEPFAEQEINLDEKQTEIEYNY